MRLWIRCPFPGHIEGVAKRKALKMTTDHLFELFDIVARHSQGECPLSGQQGAGAKGQRNGTLPGIELYRHLVAEMPAELTQVAVRL